jgi:hypothetical protein
MAKDTSHNLLDRVLKKFNSLLFFSPEERAAKIEQVLRMPHEGLLEFMKFLDEAHNEQDKYIRTICEKDEGFSKNVYEMFGQSTAKKGAKKKLKKLKKEIKHDPN